MLQAAAPPHPSRIRQSRVHRRGCCRVPRSRRVVFDRCRRLLVRGRERRSLQHKARIRFMGGKVGVRGMGRLRQHWRAGHEFGAFPLRTGSRQAQRDCFRSGEMELRPGRLKLRLQGRDRAARSALERAARRLLPRKADILDWRRDVDRALYGQAKAVGVSCAALFASLVASCGRAGCLAPMGRCVG